MNKVKLRHWKRYRCQSVSGICMPGGVTSTLVDPTAGSEEKSLRLAYLDYHGRAGVSCGTSHKKAGTSTCQN